MITHAKPKEEKGSAFTQIFGSVKKEILEEVPDENRVIVLVGEAVRNIEIAEDLEDLRALIAMLEFNVYRSAVLEAYKDWLEEKEYYLGITA